MQTQKWVNLGLLLSTFLIFLFFGKAFELIWDLSGFVVNQDWVVAPYYGIAAILAAALGMLGRQNNALNGYLNEVAVELSLVAWPDRQETIRSSWVVIIMIGVSTGVLFLIDTIWRFLIKGILSV